MVHVVSEPRLEESYRTCRRLQRRHDPTYYWATRCLPRDVQPAVHALYGFVRGADQIVDGPRRPPAGPPRRAALDAWQAELERGLAAGHSEHPVIAALVDAGPRHGLPLHLLGRYMDSMRVDCDEPVRIASRAQLDDYMEGSAATVGRVMAPLLGAPEPEAVARLGVAFQLTNFIRDVPAGLGPRPRLPAGAARGRPARGRRQRLGARAHRRRRSPAPAGCSPRPPAWRSRRRPGCAAACAWPARSTRAVLDRVEGNGYDVLGARVAACARGRPRARRRRAMSARPADAPTSSSAERRSRGSRWRASSRARAPTCSSSTATRSARARRRPARRRRRGCTRWASRGAIRRELPAMTFTTPHGTVRYRLPWSWSAFDYRELCAGLWAQCGDARFEIAKVDGRSGPDDRHTDRGDLAGAARGRRAWAGGAC